MSWITLRGRRHHVQTEACQPYSRFPASDPPADIWEIVDRLTEKELKDLVVAFSIHKPVMFEARLLQIWAERDCFTETQITG